MAIAHVTSVQSTAGTFAVDATGGNIIVVGTGTRANTSSPQNRDITGVTYNGVALTKAVDFDNSVGGSDRINVEIWYLVNPASGSNNVVVSTYGAVQSLVYGAIVLSGVSTASPIDAVGTGATASSNSPSSTVTTTAANSLVIDSVMGDGAGLVLTVDGSQTQRWNTTSSSRTGVGSTEAAASAGAVSMDWTASIVSNPPWAAVSAAFREDVGGILSTSDTVTVTESVSLSGLGGPNNSGFFGLM